jgi:hypothetical protein
MAMPMALVMAGEHEHFNFNSGVVQMQLHSQLYSISGLTFHLEDVFHLNLNLNLHLDFSLIKCDLFQGNWKLRMRSWEIGMETSVNHFYVNTL